MAGAGRGIQGLAAFHGGAVKRWEFSSTTRRKALDRSRDECGIPRCEGVLPHVDHYRGLQPVIVDVRCGMPSPRLEHDHRVPAELGGDNSLNNCVVLCKSCHSLKTQNDVKEIVRMRRAVERHYGARPPSRRPIPGSKNTPFKKKFGGKVERR